MDYFNKSTEFIFKTNPDHHHHHHHSHEHQHDEDGTDTEDDSGIAEESESCSSIATTPINIFPNLKIDDPLQVQDDALSNFFNYW